MIWKYFGTLVNVAAVLIGGTCGLLLRGRKPSRAEAAPGEETLSDAMMFCLGLCTIFAAASGLLGVESGTQAILVVVSMVLGLLIGHALHLEERIARLSEHLTSSGGQTAGQGAHPAAGFLTASLLFCIGSMTVLGSFEGAMNPPDALELSCHTTLLIKSLLDLVSATCLAIGYGASVLPSALFVLLFQGALTLLASVLQPFLLSIHALPVLYCVGSLILLAIALNLMGIRKTRTADFLPALALPALLCWLMSACGIAV